MSLQPFVGFDRYRTHHCVTGSLKHIYDYHGYPVSEELLLGLGRGLGFAYFHIKGLDPFYGGRGNVARPGEEGLEKTAGRRTGVIVESHTTSSTRRAQQTLRSLLEASEPVLLYLDMGFLPYLDLPDDYHFGAHVVVVAGYDAESGRVLIADRDLELHPVEWDTLEEARGSTFKPFPPQHKWYTFDFGDAHPPGPQEVWESIGEVCRAMLAPPISNLGVAGIRKARKETLKWPKVLDAEALRRTCSNVAMFIDHRGGTGGGIFRYMYGRFLEEAAGITTEPRLAELGTDLEEIGDRWEGVAEGFARAAAAEEPGSLLEEATLPMDDIASAEEALWQRLDALVPA